MGREEEKIQGHKTTEEGVSVLLPLPAGSLQIHITCF